MQARQAGDAAGNRHGAGDLLILFANWGPCQ